MGRAGLHRSLCRTGNGARARYVAVIDTAATRVLGVADPFDRYIFSDIDPRRLESLKSRSATRFPNRDAKCVLGDCNANIAVMANIPKPTVNMKVLPLCFAARKGFRTCTSRPFDGCRRCSSISSCSSRREWTRAGTKGSTFARTTKTLRSFTGREEWREDRGKDATLQFGDFVALQFGKSMSKLDYIFRGLSETHEMRNTKRKSPIYRLALFSRKDLGPKFWDECRKYASDKRKLF